jgi:hypothetical protein
LDKPLIKSLAKLVKKTVNLLPQPLENYLVCKLPCALTEAMLDPTRGTSRRTRCCFTPHYKRDQVPFKIPVLITTNCYKPDGFCFNPEIASKIDQLFTNKCTAIQSITVAIMTPKLNFATHMLDSAMAYSHKNYIVKNQHGVMYSRLSEDNSLLLPYKNKLAQKLVWIKKKGVPQHPVIHFESKVPKQTIWNGSGYITSACYRASSPRQKESLLSRGIQ